MSAGWAKPKDLPCIPALATKSLGGRITAVELLAPAIHGCSVAEG
jgi:hypothetical protein